MSNSKQGKLNKKTPTFGSNAIKVKKEILLYTCKKPGDASSASLEKDKMSKNLLLPRLLSTRWQMM